MQYSVLYRKKDGGWQYVISYKDETGKWKQKSKQGFKGTYAKTKCQDAADKMIEKLKKQILSPKIDDDYSDTTFEELAKMFLRHANSYKEENTLNIYRQSVHACKSLYSTKINEIKHEDIQDCVDEWAKRVQPATVKGYICKIKHIFNFAIEHNAIVNNPAINIEIPKANKIPTVKKALTKNELKTLLNGIKNRDYKLVSLFAAKCGLRLGEILGLTWDNVNLKDKTIRIVQQWKLLRNGKYGFGILKSKNSFREIPVPDSFNKELKIYKSECEEYPDNRLFKYTNVRGLSPRLHKYYKKLGFDITAHSLRHTYATLLISNGTDFKTAAKLLGHDIKQTMYTYSHVTDDMISKAKKTINNMF